MSGFNTAATLWCSAAVAVFAGAGAIPHAALALRLVGKIAPSADPVYRLGIDQEY